LFLSSKENGGVTRTVKKRKGRSRPKKMRAGQTVVVLGAGDSAQFEPFVPLRCSDFVARADDAYVCGGATNAGLDDTLAR
jgi:hypothetical protein